MTSHLLRAVVRTLALTLVLLLALARGLAAADVCVSIDESRDTFSAQDRAAALILLARQFELAGERVVPPGCSQSYVVSHAQLGSTIVVTLSGPLGQRDATARGMDDVPTVYSQMVRSLVRGLPMDAAGVTDRTNVSRRQADEPNRVYSDSLLYSRLGYGAVFANRAFGGPSVGMIGYRRELDAFGVDVSFFNLQYRSSSGGYSYGYGYTGTEGSTGTWLKLEFLRFTAPFANKSPYFGGGLSWSVANLNSANKSWSGSGLQGEISAGYELGRASTIRVFVQADAGLPFYQLTAHTYEFSNTPPYVMTTSTDRRYVPSLAVSLGIGWQRGRRSAGG